MKNDIQPINEMITMKQVFGHVGLTARGKEFKILECYSVRISLHWLPVSTSGKSEIWHINYVPTANLECLFPFLTKFKNWNRTVKITGSTVFFLTLSFYVLES